MKAEQFLRNGADVLAERGKEYDKPEGERSMQRCISAFEIITGKRITEAEGWLFMQILKDVRQWQNPDRYHEDSAVDCVNYAALKAEALSEQGQTVMDAATAISMLDYPREPKESLKEILRMDADKPDWKDAPDWAGWLAQDASGAWWWYELEPFIDGDGWFYEEGEAELARYGQCDFPYDGSLEPRP